jgi:hypothetical protein
MKTKAIGNLNVAGALINKQEENSCTASIHCSYYAVLQYMKYILAHTDKEPLSYEEQDEQSKGKSSHEYIIVQIKQRIDRHRPKAAQEFAQTVRELKDMRIDADYSSRQFTVEESLECKQQAEGLIAKLKTYFGNL